MEELENLLQDACEKIGCWAAAIMVPDFDQKVLACKLSYGLPKDWDAVTNPIDETTLNGKAYLKKEISIKNDLDISSFPSTTTVHQFYGVMVLPIEADGKVIGTLEFINDKPNKSFGSTELNSKNNLRNIRHSEIPCS